MRIHASEHDLSVRAASGTVSSIRTMRGRGAQQRSWFKVSTATLDYLARAIPYDLASCAVGDTGLSIGAQAGLLRVEARPAALGRFDAIARGGETS